MTNFFQIANLIMQIMPSLFSALNTVQQDTGKPWEQVTVDVINHLTPGQPNAPSLSTPAKS